MSNDGKLCSGLSQIMHKDGPLGVTWASLTTTLTFLCVFILIKFIHVSPDSFLLTILTILGLGACLALVFRNVIGRGRWLFFDQNGVFHCHPQKPQFVPGQDYLTTCRSVYGDPTSLPVKGYLVHARLGGWFRRNELISYDGWPSTELSASSWDFRADLTIREKYKGRICFSSAEETLMMINQFGSVQGIYDALRRRSQQSNWYETLMFGISALDDRNLFGRSLKAKVLKGKLSSAMRDERALRADVLLDEFRQEVTEAAVGK